MLFVPIQKQLFPLDSCREIVDALRENRIATLLIIALLASQ